MLMVHFSGFYAWLKEPLSQRALEDVRQTEMIQQAWADSGKVYGYRKLHDDLLDQGETCSENRVARLASIAGIAAQIGYKRRPGQYGGKPAIVADNTLDRQFEVDAPDRVWVTPLVTLLRNALPGSGHYLHQDTRRLVVFGCRDRSVLKAYCRLVHAITHDDGSRPSSVAKCCLAAQTKDQGHDPF